MKVQAIIIKLIKPQLFQDRNNNSYFFSHVAPGAVAFGQYMAKEIFRVMTWKKYDGGVTSVVQTITALPLSLRTQIGNHPNYLEDRTDAVNGYTKQYYKLRTSTNTAPCNLSVSPRREDSRVDFPHPTWPTTATSEPLGIFTLILQQTKKNTEKENKRQTFSRRLGNCN